MSNFKFLGHPSVPELQQFNQYLQARYANIERQMEALQFEIDNLRKHLALLQRAEGAVSSEDNYDKNAALENYIKAPVLNDDLSFFENFKFENSETATLVDALSRPWFSNMRMRERLGYKIKKVVYLIESKNIQLSALKDLQDDMRDVSNAG